MSKPIQVIDSNVIIKHQDLNNLYQKYEIVTVPSVISEIRDPKARDMLKALTFELDTKMPQKKAIDFVIDFSRKTGDYISISPTDGQVIALAYQYIASKKLCHLLRNEPKGTMECFGNKIVEKGARYNDKNTKKHKGPTLLDSDEEDVDIGDDFFKKDVEENDNENTKTENIESQPEKNETENIQKEEEIQNDVKEDTPSIPLSMWGMFKSLFGMGPTEHSSSKLENTDCTDSSNQKENPKNDEQTNEEKINEVALENSKNEVNAQLETRDCEQVFNQDEVDNTELQNDEVDNTELQNDEDQLKESTKATENEEIEKPVNPNLWMENKDWDSDDEEGWINPTNFNELVGGKEELDKQIESEEIGVYIMTSDFAMQNIILQIGIPLLAIDEYMIKRVKSYILECYTCWKICRDTTKQFCPNCKYSTLLKVTCSYNSDGTLVLYRKKNWSMNKRGLKFSIPLPTGGQKNNDLILSEDQINYGPAQQRIKKAEKFREKEFYNAQQTYDNGMGYDYLKKTNKHFKSYEVGYGRKNPNDNAYQMKNQNKKK